MATYIGPDGRIHSQPVRGGTLVQPGNIAPPPGHHAHDHSFEDTHPRGHTAGIFRQLFFWLVSLACAFGLGHGIGLFLQRFIFDCHGKEGIVAGVTGMLYTAAPTILYVIAFISCLCWGSAMGEGNDYDLLGLLLTELCTGVTCLFFSAILAIAPYAAALVLGIFGLAMLIGILCAIFGG